MVVERFWRASGFLIVDDSPTNRRILFHQTTIWGMHPDLAENGSHCTSNAQAGPRSVVARMTLVFWTSRCLIMDGFELAETIRTRRSAKELPLVMLTSYNQRGHRERADDMGIDGYLAKPVRQAQLHALLVHTITTCRGMAPPSVEASELTTPAAPEKNKMTGPRGRILIAEDNSVNQKVARLQVQKLGYLAVVVGNGVEAVAALYDGEYDAILMDCQMPEMDGFCSNGGDSGTRGTRRTTADSHYCPNSQCFNRGGSTVPGSGYG